MTNPEELRAALDIADRLSPDEPLTTKEYCMILDAARQYLSILPLVSEMVVAYDKAECPRKDEKFTIIAQKNVAAIAKILGG